MVRSWQLFHQFLQCQRKTKYLKRKDMKQTNPNQPQVPNFLLKTHSGKKNTHVDFVFYFIMYDYVVFHHKKCHVQMFSMTDGPLQKNLLLCPVSP